MQSDSILHLTFECTNLSASFYYYLHTSPTTNIDHLKGCRSLTWAWILPSSVTTQWVEELVGQHRKLITIKVAMTPKAKLGLKAIFRPLIGVVDFVTQCFEVLVCYDDDNGRVSTKLSNNCNSWLVLLSSSGLHSTWAHAATENTLKLLLRNWKSIMWNLTYLVAISSVYLQEIHVYLHWVYQ